MTSGADDVAYQQNTLSPSMSAQDAGQFLDDEPSNRATGLSQTHVQRKVLRSDKSRTLVNAAMPPTSSSHARKLTAFDRLHALPSLIDGDNDAESDENTTAHQFTTTVEIHSSAAGYRSPARRKTKANRQVSFFDDDENPDALDNGLVVDVNVLERGEARVPENVAELLSDELETTISVADDDKTSSNQILSSSSFRSSRRKKASTAAASDHARNPAVEAELHQPSTPVVEYLTDMLPSFSLLGRSRRLHNQSVTLSGTTTVTSDSRFLRPPQVSFMSASIESPTPIDDPEANDVTDEQQSPSTPDDEVASQQHSITLNAQRRSSNAQSLVSLARYASSTRYYPPFATDDEVDDDGNQDSYDEADNSPSALSVAAAPIERRPTYAPARSSDEEGAGENFTAATTPSLTAIERAKEELQLYEIKTQVHSLVNALGQSQMVVSDEYDFQGLLPYL